MNLNCSYLDERSHGEEVGQHGGETLSQAALGNEAKLQLSKTNGIIAFLPGPARDVQKVGLKRERKEWMVFVHRVINVAESLHTNSKMVQT